jgi:hypothetical protein
MVRGILDEKGVRGRGRNSTCHEIVAEERGKSKKQDMIENPALRKNCEGWSASELAAGTLGHPT